MSAGGRARLVALAALAPLFACAPPRRASAPPADPRSLAAAVEAAARARHLVFWDACRTRPGATALLVFTPASGAGDYYEAVGDRIAVHKRVDAPYAAFGRLTPQGDAAFRRPSEGALLTLTVHASFHAAAGPGLLAAPGGALAPCDEGEWAPVSHATDTPPPPAE